MAEQLTLRVYRDANAPAVPIVFPNVDLTGSEIEMVLTPAKGPGGPITLSTATGELELAPPNGLLWHYTEALAASLQIGRLTYADITRVLDGKRERIGGGMVQVGRAGEFTRVDPAIVEVAGIQGPPPWVHRGAWSPGTYEPRSVTTHNGSTWLTLVATDEEPGEGSAWEVLAAAGGEGPPGPVSYTPVSANNRQIVVGEKLLANLSAGPLTWLMPVAPVEGAAVSILVDGNAGSNNLALDGNGESFLGGDDTLTVDVADARLDLIFTSGLWRY